jgi:hypothetical protein
MMDLARSVNLYAIWVDWSTTTTDGCNTDDCNEAEFLGEACWQVGMCPAGKAPTGKILRMMGGACPDPPDPPRTIFLGG